MALKNRRTISFNYVDVPLKIKEPGLLKTQLAAVMAIENKPFYKIQYVFCTDNYLLDLNQKFLNHDTYTDILTFTLSLPGEPIASEIYISAERVEENARSMGVSFKEELFRVMIHGLLHLCGYEDDTMEKKMAMRSREDFHLKDFPI